MLLDYVNLALVLLALFGIIWFIYRESPRHEATHTVHELNKHLLVKIEGSNTNYWGCLTCGKWSENKRDFDDIPCDHEK